MSIKLNNINIGIIGKPNSGKSTLFNCLLKKNISPVGDEYGLTKKLYREKFTFNDQNFTIVDTPGLRRRSKVIERTEIDRNLEVIKLIKNIDTIILLIDSLENITKQDFKLADLVIKEK
jgi:small GTP-binding protein domain